MYLITTHIQKSRSKGAPEKPGTLFFKVVETVEDGDSLQRTARLIKTDISLNSIDDIGLHKEQALRFVKIIYCVIEKLKGVEVPFVIDDVINGANKALAGDSSMKDVIERTDTDFPLRTDVATIGHIFRGELNVEYAGKETANPDSLLDYIFNKSQELKNQGRDSFSRSFKNTKASLVKYLNGQDMAIGDVNRVFLENYSQWLKDNGVADSTQSFYIRTIRSILKAAKEDGLVDYDDDLFIGLNTKIVYDKEDQGRSDIDKNVILRIEKLKLGSDPELALARDMFMFAFYCRGMELVDIIDLTKDNIKDGKLTYNRRSKGLQKSVLLDHNALDIVQMYSDLSSTYIFPVKEANKGLATYSIGHKIRKLLLIIGEKIGYKGLSFSKNIDAWENLISQTNVADLLLGKKHKVS